MASSSPGEGSLSYLLHSCWGVFWKLLAWPLPLGLFFPGWINSYPLSQPRELWATHSCEPQVVTPQVMRLLWSHCGWWEHCGDFMGEEDSERASWVVRTRRWQWGRCGHLGAIMSDESESSRSVTRKISLTKKANYIFVTFTFIALSSECPQKDGLWCKRLTERRASPDKVTTAW